MRKGMKVADGNVITVHSWRAAHPGATSKGEVVRISEHLGPARGLVGVALNTVTATEDLLLGCAGVYEGCDKVSDEVISVGDAVHVNSTTKVVTKVTSSPNQLCGYAMEDAGDPSDSVAVFFHPVAPTA